MLKLKTSDVVQAPVDQVFQVARDELPKLVPYLPNIGRIEVRERTESGPSKIRIVNRWHAKAEIPAAAAKFVSQDLLSWEDTAEWDADKKSVTYELKSFVSAEIFRARGTNTFIRESDGTTRLEVDVEVDLKPEKVPGVPRLLASMVKPAVEELIKKILTPNLTSLAKGLNGYFTNQKG
jgi:hypothetical protein